MTTLTQFIAGEQLAYRAFSGERMTAVWRSRAVPYLTIRDQAGKVKMAPAMDRATAEAFYVNIERDKAFA